jgi:hypothetical protein
MARGCLLCAAQSRQLFGGTADAPVGRQDAISSGTLLPYSGLLLWSVPDAEGRNEERVDDVLRRHDEPYCGTIATKAHYNSVICGARDVDYNAILPTGFAVKRPVSEGPRPSGGRRKGVPNRVGGDLRLAIVAAIQETGFIMQSGLLITTPPRLTSDELPPPHR